MSRDQESPHPGKQIRNTVIPAGMSVTEAAQILGVGRPALSNLLNGKAALSSDMAARLHKAFNCSAIDLMDMQARYDTAQAKTKTPAYVPPFLAIKANDIEHWASHNIAARSRLAVLLRVLVHSTGNELTKVDFPGNDDSQRPGWDGFVDASEGSAWVPVGHSGWEFGTNEDPRAKANSDFEKSVDAHSQKDRERTTFVFVTPRRWSGKAVWIEAQQAKSVWRDVRAYDASDLEQWLHSQAALASRWLWIWRAIFDLGSDSRI